MLNEFSSTKFKEKLCYFLRFTHTHGLNNPQMERSRMHFPWMNLSNNGLMEDKIS